MDSATFVQHSVNGLQLGLMYALIALGYTMVYGILRLINFAHGDVFMVGAYAAYFVGTALTQKNPATGAALMGPGMATAMIALVAAMAVCALLGVTIERFAYRPLRSAPRIAALITAIGVSFLLENLCVVMLGATPRGFPTLIHKHDVFSVAGVPISNYQVMLFILSLLLMGALQYIVQHTMVGKAMRAVSFDQDAARLMGINVNAVIAWTFVIGSALAAAAGMLYAMNYPKVEPYMGIFPGLKAFVAAVVGGIGNIPGAVAGALIMGFAETLVIALGYSTYRDAVAFALLIVILFIRPTGILGKGLVEKV
ncbi:MAG: branched-chain amino acid ABC transporter permease [Armatimonadetes bacterium]|nr:branched-chain amino acid ABC transporter permease [Armatimonadota bacterium]